MLHEQLTENDVKKIKEEIEYRKLTVRKKCDRGSQRGESTWGFKRKF